MRGRVRSPGVFSIPILGLEDTYSEISTGQNSTLVAVISVLGALLNYVVPTLPASPTIYQQHDKTTHHEFSTPRVPPSSCCAYSSTSYGRNPTSKFDVILFNLLLSKSLAMLGIFFTAVASRLVTARRSDLQQQCCQRDVVQHRKAKG